MDSRELDTLQLTLQQALERWVITIQRWQELLANTTHSARSEDVWKQADFDQDEAETAVKKAKAAYEDAVRHANFGF